MTNPIPNERGRFLVMLMETPHASELPIVATDQEEAKLKAINYAMLEGMFKNPRVVACRQL